MDLDPVRHVLDAQVAGGRLPGYVAAVRHRGDTQVLTGGTTAFGGSAPVRPDTLFRLASLTKPFAGALALALVEDGVLALDDPVARWLPELAAPRVLRDRAGPLEDTVAAERPITVRHLLCGTPGFGGVPGGGPLARAIDESQIGPSAWGPPVAPEEYLRRLAALPLAAQPGEVWLYHLASDVLGILLSRATGRPVSQLLAERVTGPLGLRDTGFRAPDAARLVTCYLPTEAGLEVVDAPGGFAAAPPFESLAAGLVSTAPDVLAFLAALADGGAPVLPARAVAAMTTDVLTDAQRAAAADSLGPGISWGLQTGVCVSPVRPWTTPGRWGWDGGTGTSGWADPAEDLVAVLLTQRMMAGPDDEPTEFWRTLYACRGAPLRRGAD
ncbi:serine hydrolase domain-containing protein [Geodermatophilus sp. CPCC 206100]|uniref:serine hydrolase domain-containing protein n=1 Tax=Geodermatophilus sp. CPCC 206100 TaxID=3020054 RepID=UPI003B00689D